MYIKMLDGRYAGEVRDIENGTALALLENGRATKAFTEKDSAGPRLRAADQVRQAIEPAAGVRDQRPQAHQATVAEAAAPQHGRKGRAAR
jgi:hypothetical protein